MVKKTGICLVILGSVIIFWFSARFFYAITTSYEEMMNQAEADVANGKADAIYLEFLRSEGRDSLTIDRILSSFFMLAGTGLLLSGIGLYRVGKRVQFANKLQWVFAKQNKQLVIALVVFFGLFIFNSWLSAMVDAPALLFGLVIWVFAIVYVIRELIFFNYNFGNVNRHLVNWEYPNGDLLIVTCWGLMKYNQTVPKLSVSSKFEGFKWDIDNAKDLAESLIKNEGNPLMALLPSIEFSTTTNRVEDYIPFSFVDNVDLTFIDKDEGYLIININKKNYNREYRLTYPMPATKTSIESEVDIFESRIDKRWTPVRGVYLDKGYVEEVLSAAAPDNTAWQ